MVIIECSVLIYFIALFDAVTLAIGTIGISYLYKFELENSTVNAKGNQNQSTQKLPASYHSSSFHHKVAAVNQLCNCQPTNQNCVPASQSEVSVPVSPCSCHPIRSVYLPANQKCVYLLASVPAHHQCVCQPACVSSSQPSVCVPASLCVI